MRAVIQRVSRGRVTVDGVEVGSIGLGWAILLGVGPSDDEAGAASLADTIVKIRAFGDERGRMNLAAADVGAELLVVSQVTLYADLARGRRPSLTTAAPPELAARLVEHFVGLLRDRGFRVATGVFGAMMDVEIVNQGPVTFVLSSDD